VGGFLIHGAEAAPRTMLQPALAILDEVLILRLGRARREHLLQLELAVTALRARQSGNRNLPNMTEVFLKQMRHLQDALLSISQAEH
jgi:hypothetical protein